MSEQAAIKDKRVGVACEECRKRKRKCDGLRPTCTSCTVSSRVCEYAGTCETRKRRHWDAEYVSTLEDEISSLRAYIAETQRTADTGPPNLSKHRYKLQAHKQHDSKATSEQISHDPAEEDSQPTSGTFCSSAIEDLSALVWRMKLGDRGEPDFIGPSGNFCFPSSQSPVPLSMKESIVQSADAKDFSSKFSNDYEIKRKLTTVFMTGLNPIHHFLPPSTFLEPDLYPFDDPGINLLHSATFAAGALLSPVLLDRKAGDAFASQAEVSAISACRLQPSVIVVQALSIIAWRELSLEHNNLAQIYLSMAGGLATGLGLHVIGLDALSESYPSKTLSDIERDIRLRSFWAFFLLDRIATSILGRNCIIPWRRVEVPPLSITPGEPVSVDEIAFIHQCKLWQLHDKFMDQIYAFDFTSLQFAHRSRLLLAARAEILAFKHDLPQILQTPNSNSSSVIPRSVGFLHMSYHMSLLLIHRPYLREEPESSSFTLAVATLSSAATRMTQCIQVFYKQHLRDISHETPTPALPFFIHHVLTASVVHLLLGTSRRQPLISSSRRKLQICMEVLASLQSIWPSASKAIMQIQQLAVRWKVVHALPLKWTSFLSDTQANAHNAVLMASKAAVTSTRAEIGVSMGGNTLLTAVAGTERTQEGATTQPTDFENSDFWTSSGDTWNNAITTNNQNDNPTVAYTPNELVSAELDFLNYPVDLAMQDEFDSQYYVDHLAMQDVFDADKTFKAFE